jgi:hypothetical protein
LNHVIVGVGHQVQEWYYHPPPPQPRVPPPSVDFAVTPDDGRRNHAYFNVGGSATLQWTVTSCQNCAVSMRGFGGLDHTYDKVILNSPHLPAQGAVPVTPGNSADRLNTKYVLTATGANGTTSREVYVRPVHGARARSGRSAGVLFQADQSPVICAAVPYLLRDSQRPGHGQEGGGDRVRGYKAESITAGSVTTACQ